MDYLPEEQLFFWKKLLLNTDKFIAGKAVSIIQPFASFVDDHWTKQLNKTSIIACLIELAYYRTRQCKNK